jgi:predicted DNA-binding protein YlxM (UPF0122 family)
VTEQTKIDALRKTLKRGWAKKIADDIGVTRQYVSDVIRGKYENDRIMSSFLELVEQKKKRKATIEKKANKLSRATA